MNPARALVAALFLAACATTTTPPSEPGEDEVLRPEVSEAEARQQQIDAATAIDRASAALAAVDNAGLAEQDRRRLELARDLLSQARDAHDEGDYERSSELASKAAVMAEDLAGR